MRFLKFIKALSIVLPLSFVCSCNYSQESSEDTPSEDGDSVSYNDWDSNEWYNDEDPRGGKSDGGGQIVDEKGYVCPICGHYFDETIEGEKHCGDVDGRSVYEFEAYDSKVMKTTGSFGAMSDVNDEHGHYIGNFSQNLGCKLEWKIKVEKACRVTLKLNCSNRTSTTYTLKTIALRVNGVRIDNWSMLSKTPSASDWTSFITTTLGCVNLIEGENLISIGVEDDVASFNIHSLIVLSDEPLIWLNNEYVDPDLTPCEHQDENGYCTDLDSNSYHCLNKDVSSWEKLEISGENDEVLKEGGCKWTNENTIGIINDNVGQTISVAFNLTQDSYIRIDLEQSLSGVDNKYCDEWDFYFNDEKFTTGARTVKGNGQDWFIFEWTTIAYLKGKSGFNQFSMTHKVKRGDNIRAFNIYVKDGSASLAQAISKTEE